VRAEPRSLSGICVLVSAVKSGRCGAVVPPSRPRFGPVVSAGGRRPLLPGRSPLVYFPSPAPCPQRLAEKSRCRRGTELRLLLSGKNNLRTGLSAAKSRRGGAVVPPALDSAPWRSSAPLNGCWCRTRAGTCAVMKLLPTLMILREPRCRLLACACQMHDTVPNLVKGVRRCGTTMN
jgi:hypothetical protein